MSVQKQIKTVERDGKHMPAIVSKDSGKIIKLEKDYASEDELKLSNKDAVYLAWKDGEDDVDSLHDLVNKAVKKTTIKNWLSKWKNDKGLPRISKD